MKLFKLKICVPLFLIILVFSQSISQEIIKYSILDNGTSLSVGTAVKLNAAGQIEPCGDNDSLVIGLITSKEISGGTSYYLVSSCDVALVPLPSAVSVGDNLTTAASGGLRTASAGEIIVGIAMENGDGNPATLEKVMLTLGYASPNKYIANQISSAQRANFWVDDTGRAGYLIVDSAAVINESGGNYDFRVESDNEENMFFVDADSDMVGIRTSSPSSNFFVDGSFGTATVNTTSDYTIADTNSVIFVDATSSDVRITLPSASGIAGRRYTIKKD